MMMKPSPRAAFKMPQSGAPVSAPDNPASPAARFRWTLICDTGSERCPTPILRFPGPPQRPGGRPARARKPAAAARAASLPSAKRVSFWSCFVARIWSPRAASMASPPPPSPSGAMPSWLLVLRRSKSGRKPSPTRRAGGIRESSPRRQCRSSCCASASGAWRTRSLFCGGGRACEPRPLGLHRADVRAPLGC